MVTLSWTNFFIRFGQASQVLSGNFIKRNLANSCFQLNEYDNWTKTVYILCRYTSVGTKLTKVVLLEAGLSHIW